jgi:alkaline phosphatase
MKRRDFFKGSSALIGASLLSPTTLVAQQQEHLDLKDGQAKNIIFMVSDGMSAGTLNMTDMLLRRKEGRASNWISLYEQNRVKRAFMDTASANSLITDSAAASSSWGGGKRVNNGSLNTNADGSENTPIWRKFKAAGKSAGCVTTVPITHATPAGFCVSSKGRSDQAGIALKYLASGFDVLLGGGLEFFSPSLREDKDDVFKKYRDASYTVLRNKKDLVHAATADNKLIGVFNQDGLPYTLDRANDASLMERIPTLSEMTATAINKLSKNPKGFVLQVEAGKVDWAAHANDIGALLYDQIAFDDAIKVVLDFAEKSKDTLVVITTDHGNANPGLFYGAKANQNFDKIQTFKHTNEWILSGVDKNTSTSTLIEKIAEAQGYSITKGEALAVLKHYQTLDEKGIYNPRSLPYRELAQLQTTYTSVGWGSMDHSADYVELAMLGPGSELLNPFVRNFELHNLMLKAAGLTVESM